MIETNDTNLRDQSNPLRSIRRNINNPAVTPI